jgi:diacylglycerol kinase family enzyme
MAGTSTQWWRRLTALVAFVAAALVPIVGLVYLVRFLAELAVAAVLSAAIVAALWFALTRKGAARLAGLVFALAAFVAALAMLAVAGAIVGLLVVVGLTIVAFVTARAAIGGDRRRVAARAAGWQPAATASHAVLLMNPHSGGGKVERFGLVHEAERRGIEPVVMNRGDDLAALARAAVARGADVLGMAGGDGSLGIVAAIAAEHGVAFVAVPAGTRNHFALDLGVDREDVVGALDAFSGLERRIDLGRVNDRPFLNNVSLGIYATIVQSPDYRDAKAGTFARLLPDLLGPSAMPFDLHFETPDGEACDDSQLVLVSNNAYRFDRLEDVGSRPRLDRGELGVVATAIAGSAQAAEFVALEIAGRVRRFGGWREWRAPSLSIASAAPVKAGIDGEAVELDPPLHFSVESRALRVRVAAHHPGASPGAAAPWLSRQTLVDLWHAALGR